MDENGRLFHGGYWLEADDLPVSGTKFVKYYMHSNGSLSTGEPKHNDASVSYQFNPDDPVPTIGGSMAASQPLWVGGAFDQREKEYNGNPEKGFYGSKPPYLPLKARKDVVVYQTEILKEDVQVIGPIKVIIHASSDARDTDFTAKLIDVYPSSADYPAGYEMNITDGIIRSRYRNSPEKQELMEPGTIYEFTIKPFSTANVFKKGHRIRVDISSSNFPRFDVNPNTGEPIGKNTMSKICVNTIYHDAINCSYIVLPVVDAKYDKSDH
jgi:putative CocE/NonD family hydrolase